MNSTKSKKSAFTLIELIIYIAIVSMVMVMLIDFTWNIIDAGTRVEVASELTQNSHLVMKKVTNKVRMAQAIITGSSTFNSHPGTLVLDMPGSGTDITFDTYIKQVSVGTETVSIRKIRMQEGVAAAIDLTSDKVEAVNFVFRNFSRGTDAKNINFECTLNSVNPSSDTIRDKSISFETSVTIRKK
ncbi:prepilin-type N-terminal cleavage/methylation domain-containing protein [Patescibacteria group bacterium]|nr:prepilin-type N-terminal cleavage/methylation domain-containing protein [Patescibacteria group bacterium]